MSIQNSTQFFWTNKQAIRDYIATYGRGPSSKDYELVVAVILAQFCEEQFGTECHIGFELDQSRAREVPNGGLATLEEIMNVLKKKVTERTPVDIAITPDATATGKRRGISFQLKRFGKDPKANNTDDLINFLNNEIPESYQAGMRITFVLILESGSELDLPRVIKDLKTGKYPFERIMYTGIARGKIIIGELFPNQGSSEYDLSDFAMRSANDTSSN